MRDAETILNIIRERGRRGLPVRDAYRLLFQKGLHLRAYGRIHRNAGALTAGVTDETVDGMSEAKIDAIIDAVRHERYRWSPARRVHIPKANGKKRPLGLPVWSDKLLQEVIRSLLDAYYEPRFSPASHGFRPGRGCHTALQDVVRKGKGTKWFIEGDIAACFDSLDRSVLVERVRMDFPDNRFVRLIEHLLAAGYMEDWTFNATRSGVPQGGVVSPILSNLVLDLLDRYVEGELIPGHTRGRRRRVDREYGRLTVAASKARRAGNPAAAKALSREAQRRPSRDPNDPGFRRLWYVRYADDFLLGFVGPKAEALDVKRKLAAFLRDRLKLTLSDDKTLITHARDGRARFLGYEVHALHEDAKHDRRGQRSINGSVGLRVPEAVLKAHRARYERGGRPHHLGQRTVDSAYAIVAQYQAELRGVVQYYRLAYNVSRLHRLKRVMEVSLAKTLANKFKTTCTKVYKKYGARVEVDGRAYRVLRVAVERPGPKPPLTAYFGGVPMRWNRFAKVDDAPTRPVFGARSEVVERLTAGSCELCGGGRPVEVHHVRKLADLRRRPGGATPEWVRRMAARRRKTLVVCRPCHAAIHGGRHDGPRVRGMDRRRAG